MEIFLEGLFEGIQHRLRLPDVARFVFLEFARLPHVDVGRQDLALTYAEGELRWKLCMPRWHVRTK
jgi:hypothetical protein